MTEKQAKIISHLEKGLLAALFAGSILGGLLYGLLVREVASRDQLVMLARYRPSTPTRLYDRNGNVFAELYRYRQEVVPYHEIPPHVVEAYLAVEDDNFFHHFGLDFFGIIRAAIRNVLAMGIVQGGSTLTQQLAKQIFLNAEGKRERTFTQKIKETVLALQMEEELSKEEILEVYFNVIYQGHGCKGISCASRLYFDKPVEDLSLAEGALLARLPKSPVEFSPFKNPREAMRQNKIVLQLMASDGFVPKSEVDSIHKKFWEHYWAKVVTTSPSQNIYADRLDQAPYFTDYIRQILETADEIGPENLYTRGLRIYTTLDLKQQLIAEDEMKKMRAHANEMGRKYALQGRQQGVDTGLVSLYSTLSLLFPLGQPDIKSLSPRGYIRKGIERDLLDAAELLTNFMPADNEAAAFQSFRRDTVSYTSNLEVQDAFLAVEPKTGYITTMIGGSDFSPQNQFNRAIQARRQPGSSFKIFVYGAALEQRKISSNTGLNDAPFAAISADGSTWSPANYGEGFRGMVPAAMAFALSLNTCSVQTYYKVGPDPIIDLASRMMKINDRARFNPDPALALGASEVTPMEMATAVSIIANEGKDVIPFAIRYVTDQSGNVLYNQEAKVRRIIALKTRDGSIQVIEPGLAFILRKIMQDVVDHGTANGGIRGNNYTGDMAAKTGTTSSWSDAWTVGFNPDYATVAWFGFDKSSITLGPGEAGGALAAPAIGRFLYRYYDGDKSKFPSFASRSDGDRPPPGVMIGACNGYVLAPTIWNGQHLVPPLNQACAGESSRIYDQRELLMQEMGITPQELGVQGRFHFKADR